VPRVTGILGSSADSAS